MADFLTKEQRSLLMSKIRSKGTKPELEMARLLDEAGIAYEKHRKDLPGTPDFVVSRVAVFTDGSFWHGRHFDRWKSKLKPFWLAKITNNRKRDKRVNRKLRVAGYRIVRLWEEDVWKKPEKCVRRVRASVSPLAPRAPDRTSFRVPHSRTRPISAVLRS